MTTTSVDPPYRVWRPEDLATLPLYGEMVGVEAAKLALESVVTKPLSFAETHYKRVQTPRLLVLAGAAGSGRRTLVLAFARHAQIECVVEVLAPTPRALADAVAAAEAPALVFTRYVEAAALHVAPSAESGGLRDMPRHVFIVVAATASRSGSGHGGGHGGVDKFELPPALLEHAYRGVAAPLGYSWLPPASWTQRGQEAPADRFLARLQLLRLMMRQRSMPGAPELKREQLQELCVLSHQTTARQLATYLDRVYARPLDRLSLQEIAAATPERVTPTWADFEACLYQVHGSRLITPQLPEDQSVHPYEPL